MAQKFASAKPSPRHAYNPSIGAEPFELDKFDATILHKECDGNVLRCESLRRIGIILKKYRAFLSHQHKQPSRREPPHKNSSNNALSVNNSNAHTKFPSTGMLSNSLLAPTAQGHTAGHSLNFGNAPTIVDNMASDLLAIYQQQVYGNHQPMMKRALTDSMHDLINSKLGAHYSTTALLDDFHHLLYTHSHGNGEFDAMYAYIVEQIGGGKCVASTCEAFLRNNHEFDLNVEQESVQEIQTRSTLNQIHCFFLHSFDCYRFTEKELKNIAQYESSVPDHAPAMATDRSESNSTADSLDNNDNPNNAMMDANVTALNPLDKRLAIVCKMLHKKQQHMTRPKHYIKLPFSNGGAGVGAAGGANENILENLSVTYPKYVTFLHEADVSALLDSTTQHQPAPLAHCAGASGVYGKKYYYWDYYKANTNVDTLNGGFISDWYVTNKHRDLKHEILHNKQCQLSKQTFDYLHEHATVLMSCARARKLRATAFGVLLREYGIEKRSAITLPHLMVLLMYSNVHELQRAFLSSFNARAQDKSMDDVINRHSQFAHFAKHIRECVEIYAAQSTRVAEDFYHVIHGQYLFSDTMVWFASPISCSASLNVACSVSMHDNAQAHYSDGDNGLVLQFARYHPHASGCVVFDCQWLSHLVNENERLLYCSSAPLRIVAMFDLQRSLNYHHYVSGLNYLSALLHCNNSSIGGSREEEDKLSRFAETAASFMITNQLQQTPAVHHHKYDLHRPKKSKNAPPPPRHHKHRKQGAEIPRYMQQLFVHYCETAPAVLEIDVDKINDRYYGAKRHLMTPDDSWVYMDRLCTLFPNAQCIVVKEGPYLTNDTFKRLLAFLESALIKNGKCKLHKIIFKYPKEEADISCDEGIKQYYEAIRHRHWDAFYSQNVDGDLISLYFVNQRSMPLSTHAGGNHHTDLDYFAFELWKTIIKARNNDFSLSHELSGNFLISHIQQYFPNRFPTGSDDDILLAINQLLEGQYLRVMYDKELTASNKNSNMGVLGGVHKYDFRYQFEMDKYREFVKRSEPFRQHWSVTTKVKIFSSHHGAWKNAVVVEEIGDILTVSFQGHHKKIVDRYQHDIITALVPSSNNSNHNNQRMKMQQRPPNYFAMSQSSMANNHGSASLRSSSTHFMSRVSSNPGSPLAADSSAGSNLTLMGNLKKRVSRVSFALSALTHEQPLYNNNNNNHHHHHQFYESGMSGVSESTTRTSYAMMSKAGTSTRRSTQAYEQQFTPEFAPCKGDPFWDYYRTVGDMSRANGDDLIRVMKFISAGEIMRQLLQHWIHHKIEPADLPYATSLASAAAGDAPGSSNVSDANFSLSTSSIITFVRQALNCRPHPSTFDIPKLTRCHDLYFDDDDKESVQRMSLSYARSVSHETGGSASSSESVLNRIGQYVFSFLDQSSFLRACLVSRAWFYCSRAAKSRSHIRFRLWSALRFLIRDSDLMNLVTLSNDIISIQKFMRDRYHTAVKGRNSSKRPRHRLSQYPGAPVPESSYGEDDEEALSPEELQHDDRAFAGGYAMTRNMDGDDIIDYEEEKWTKHDILINFAEGIRSNNELRKTRPRNRRRQPSLSHDGRNSLPHFFSTRIDCNMFERLVHLQFDFTIPSGNKLIYYINQTLYESYWQTLSLLFGIESLLKIDLLFPDPHILLLAYILQNSLNYSKNSKQIRFPSIGIMRSKFVCLCKNLQSLRFAVKSLTLSKLESMLNTHFEHYYHPSHHHSATNKYHGGHATDDPEYAAYVYAQSNKTAYSQLDIYQICRKVIHKSIVFDITNGLYCLNHAGADGSLGHVMRTVQELTLCDVKCLSKELSLFLNNNANHLRSVQIMFTQKCLSPKYVPRYGQNGAYSPIVTPGGSSTLPSINPTIQSSSTYSVSGYGAAFGALTLASAVSTSTKSTDDNVSKLQQKQQQRQVQEMHKTNRIRQTVTELFSGILKYLHKQTAVIHDHNHQIKKKFKLAKKKRTPFRSETPPKLQMAYANKLRVLPLESLSFSFPFDIDISILDGYIELFKYFEINDCAEICLKNIYLDGGCITPFTFHSKADIENNAQLTRSQQHWLLWSSALESQVSNIEVLVMKRILYSTCMFYEQFNVGLVSQLRTLDLQIIFSDEYDDPYLHNEARQPILELFDALKHCRQLQVLCLDLIQHPQNCHDIHSVMMPSLDIMWLHQFMKHRNIRNNIQRLNVSFNELCTDEFENVCDSAKYIRRTHLNLGAILRINEEFKEELQDLITSWFHECPKLNDVKLIRHIASNPALNENSSSQDAQSPITVDNHSHSDRYKLDQNVDFQHELPFEKKSNYINLIDNEQSNHNMAFYGVSKPKLSEQDVLVSGELAKVLIPQNPVE